MPLDSGRRTAARSDGMERQPPPFHANFVVLASARHGMRGKSFEQGTFAIIHIPRATTLPSPY
jgi:hypothetical protein